MTTTPSSNRVDNPVARVLVAIVIAPVFGALFFGSVVIFSIPVMLGSAIFFALPLFFLLRKFKWLQWWHALAAGIICSLPFTILYWAVAPTYHFEYAGLLNSLQLVATGALVGVLFWWIGIFRNPAFPYVSPRPPKGMLVLLPVALLGAWYIHMLEPHDSKGRVLDVLESPSYSTHTYGRVSMRLQDGKRVVGLLPEGLDVPTPVGLCFSLSERWSATLSEKVYFLEGPKVGIGSDDC